MIDELLQRDDSATRAVKKKSWGDSKEQFRLKTLASSCGFGQTTEYRRERSGSGPRRVGVYVRTLIRDLGGGSSVLSHQ